VREGHQKEKRKAEEMHSSNKPQSLLAPNKKWGLFLFLVVFLCGLGTRLYDLKDPPLDYAATRQLRSALIARGKYYQWAENVPEWKREIALKQGRHSMIEPTIMENLVAATYWIVGGEYVWIARIYSAVFWSLGGIALFLLLREMVSVDGALIGLIYYLFNPFGLVASRTFQPDPLMTALIIFSWWTFYRWYQSRTWKWALWTGAAAGSAMLVKSTAVFFLLGGMGLLILTTRSFKETWKDLQVWTVAGVAGLPVLAYHLYGVFVVGTLGKQFQGRFIPELLKTSTYYRRLLNALTGVSGHDLLFYLGIIGLLYYLGKKEFWFVVGIWVGYLFYCLFFTYHSITHYYYHLPLIPLLSLGFSGIADIIISRLENLHLPNLVKLTIRGGVIVLVVLGVGGGHYLFQEEEYRHEPDFYYQVANFVPRESNKIVLSQDYGYRISYYGWITPKVWLGTEDLVVKKLRGSSLQDFTDKFQSYVEGYDYFIITRKQEFRRQQALYEELHNNYQVHKQGGGYIIFDLNRPRGD